MGDDAHEATVTVCTAGDEYGYIGSGEPDSSPEGVRVSFVVDYWSVKESRRSYDIITFELFGDQLGDMTNVLQDDGVDWVALSCVEEDVHYRLEPHHSQTRVECDYVLEASTEDELWAEMEYYGEFV